MLFKITNYQFPFEHVTRLNYHTHNERGIAQCTISVCLSQFLVVHTWPQSTFTARFVKLQCLNSRLFYSKKFQILNIIIGQNIHVQRWVLATDLWMSIGVTTASVFCVVWRVFGCLRCTENLNCEHWYNLHQLVKGNNRATKSKVYSTVK